MPTMLSRQNTPKRKLNPKFKSETNPRLKLEKNLIVIIVCYVIYLLLIIPALRMGQSQWGWEGDKVQLVLINDLIQPMTAGHFNLDPDYLNHQQQSSDKPYFYVTCAALTIDKEVYGL